MIRKSGGDVCNTKKTMIRPGGYPPDKNSGKTRGDTPPNLSASIKRAWDTYSTLCPAPLSQHTTWVTRQTSHPIGSNTQPTSGILMAWTLLAMAAQGCTQKHTKDTHPPWFEGGGL